MDRYTKWLIRGRVIATTGVLLGVFSGWTEPLKQSSYYPVLVIIGVVITCAGILDSFGMFARRRFRDAAIEHEENMRKSSR